MGNIAFFRDEARKPVAVLIDFDLAIRSPLDKLSSEEHVGTVPFLSVEYIMCPNCEYGLHHDLESFYYCVIWHGLGYETLDKFPCEKGRQDDILKIWRIGDRQQMAFMKIAHLCSKIMQGVFDSFLDKSFTEKCKLLWEKLEETNCAWKKLARLEIEGTELVQCRLADTCEDRPTKVTAPMLIASLGTKSESDECEESCCLQLCRRPARSCQ